MEKIKKRGSAFAYSLCAIVVHGDRRVNFIILQGDQTDDDDDDDRHKIGLNNIQI